MRDMANALHETGFFDCVSEAFENETIPHHLAANAQQTELWLTLMSRHRELDELARGDKPVIMRASDPPHLAQKLADFDTTIPDAKPILAGVIKLELSVAYIAACLDQLQPIDAAIAASVRPLDRQLSQLIREFNEDVAGMKDRKSVV